MGRGSHGAAACAGRQEISPACEAQFPIDAVKLFLNGSHQGPPSPGDLGVGKALYDEPRDCPFGRGESAEVELSGFHPDDQNAPTEGLHFERAHRGCSQLGGFRSAVPVLFLRCHRFPPRVDPTRSRESSPWANAAPMVPAVTAAGGPADRIAEAGADRGSPVSKGSGEGALPQKKG